MDNFTLFVFFIDLIDISDPCTGNACFMNTAAEKCQNNAGVCLCDDDDLEITEGEGSCEG